MELQDLLLVVVELMELMELTVLLQGELSLVLLLLKVTAHRLLKHLAGRADRSVAATWSIHKKIFKCPASAFSSSVRRCKRDGVQSSPAAMMYEPAEGEATPEGWLVIGSQPSEDDRQYRPCET